MPKISAVGLFCCDKFEETPIKKVCNMSKLNESYFRVQKQLKFDFSVHDINEKGSFISNKKKPIALGLGSLYLGYWSVLVTNCLQPLQLLLQQQQKRLVANFVLLYKH